jgi:hypothetical protein
MSGFSMYTNLFEVPDALTTKLEFEASGSAAS